VTDRPNILGFPLAPGIGQFETVASDILAAPFFTSEFCEYLINEMNIAGPHPLLPDQSRNCLLHQTREGKQLCIEYANAVKQYVEPAIKTFWTTAATDEADPETRLTYGNVPIPFVKKISKVDSDLSTAIALHNDHSLFSMLVRLNSSYEGSETTYPRQDFRLNECPVGHLALMPGSVTHPHFVSELISGTKYTLVGRLTIIAPRSDRFDDINQYFSSTTFGP